MVIVTEKGVYLRGGGRERECEYVCLDGDAWGQEREERREGGGKRERKREMEIQILTWRKNRQMKQHTISRVIPYSNTTHCLAHMTTPGHTLYIYIHVHVSCDSLWVVM